MSFSQFSYEIHRLKRSFSSERLDYDRWRSSCDLGKNTTGFPIERRENIFPLIHFGKFPNRIMLL